MNPVRSPSDDKTKIIPSSEPTSLPFGVSNRSLSETSNGVKVLMLSIDKNICRLDSDARKRMIEYGDLFEELYIVVYTPNDHEKYVKEDISPNCVAITGTPAAIASIKEFPIPSDKDGLTKTFEIFK